MSTATRSARPLTVALAGCLVALLLIAAAPPAHRMAPGSVGVQATPVVVTSYAISAFANLDGACEVAVRQAPNGTVGYAFVAAGSLYYAWSGTATPVRVRATTAYCGSGLDLAYKASGAAVVAWVDERGRYNAPDGTWEGLQLYVASQDAGWANVLADPGSNLTVRSFRIGVDSGGGIHAAFARDTYLGDPYVPKVFVSASPSWSETQLTTNPNLGNVDLAVDSANGVHVVWDSVAANRQVYYANSSSGWTVVRVDSNQAPYSWDNRYEPVVAADARNKAHVVWVDTRNDDPNLTAQPNNASLYTASSANGFVNAPLVFPGNGQVLKIPERPSEAIDAKGITHVTWTEQNDLANLYYANSTDWNTAYRMTDQDAYNHYAADLPNHPFALVNNVPAVFFADSRSGSYEIWQKSTWSSGPDTTPPVVAPRHDLTVEAGRAIPFEATEAWDDDRISDWEWIFNGPNGFGLYGYSIQATFPAPAFYSAILIVRDPAAHVASVGFNVTVVPEPATAHWVTGLPLFPDIKWGGGPGVTALALGPWRGYFPLLDRWDVQYATLGANGSVLSGPVSYNVATAGVTQLASAVDTSGNTYVAGFDPYLNLALMALNPSGGSLLPATVLPVSAVGPQQPSLVYANGGLWIAWVDLRGNQTEIYLAALTATGGVAWGPARVSLTNETHGAPMLAVAGPELWIVYWSSNHLAVASRFNTTTRTFDLRDVPLATGATEAVAGLPDGGAAVIWTDYANLYLSFLASNGSPRIAGSLLNFPDGATYGSPRLVVEPGGAADVIWWDQGNWTLRYAQVAPDGSVSPFGGAPIAYDTGGANGAGFESADITMGPDGFPRIAYTTGGGLSGAVAFAYNDPIAPVARMGHDTVIREGHPARFDASPSTDNGAIASYNWTFGDGGGGAGRLVSYTYANAGTYVVTLTVTDLAGNTNRTSQSVNVVIAPTASFTVRPPGALVDQAFTLDGTGSGEPGGSLVNYTWTTSDAAVGTLYGPVVTVRFATAGSQVVTLTVRDAAGAVDSASQTVTVWPSVELVVVTSSGFRMPVPKAWETHTDYSVGGQTVPLVSIGPTVDSFRTNVLVSYLDDASAQETSAYLSSGVDGTIAGVQKDHPDAYLIPGTTYLTVSDHAAVEFTIGYSSHSFLQRAVLVVSAAHHRDWLLLLSVAASAFNETAATFEAMVAGFTITALPTLAVVAIVVGLVAGAVFLIAVVVVRRRRRRAASRWTGSPTAGRGPEASKGVPGSGPAAFCVNCGTPLPPGPPFCGRCGAPVWKETAPESAPTAERKP